MLFNNFTVYVGKYKRWIEVRPLNVRGSGQLTLPELTGHYVIYSNDRRNQIGELLPETNPENSVLGTFFYSLDENITEFEGKIILTNDEHKDIANAIQTAILNQYHDCLEIVAKHEDL